MRAFSCMRPRPIAAVPRRMLALVLVLAISLVGCQSVSPPTSTATPQLPPPTPAATPLPSPPPEPLITPPGPEITLEAGKTISVHANAEDADKYEWTLMGKGEISASTGPAVLYTAPKEGDAVAILTVTAYNAQGASPQTSLTINVPPIPPPAAISLDALAAPLGRMSCTESEGIADFIKLDGAPGNCHTGSDCMRFTYSGEKRCEGVYWFPLCIASATSSALKAVPEWPFNIALVTPYTVNAVPGNECSMDILKAGNLGKVSRLTFWTRGERGKEVIEFGVGGPNVQPIPGRSSGSVTLQSTWESHEIDLGGLSLTNAIVVFRWYANDIYNPQGAVFYLDDIQFEGTK